MDGMWLNSSYWCRKAIDGKANHYVYKDILVQSLLLSAQFNIESYFVFQHDNDPIYAARSAEQWLSENIKDVLKWPAKFYPNLNLVESDHLLFI